MIKNLKIFKTKKSPVYDLVTIRRYNGVEDGMHSWTFLSYAIVEKTEDGKAVCLRDRNIEYEYAKEIENGEFVYCDYSNINIGDIKVFSSFSRSFDRNLSEAALRDFMDESDLYFDDDVKYGKVKHI